MKVNTFNPSTQQAGRCTQISLGLRPVLGYIQANQGYRVRPCLRKKKKTNKYKSPHKRRDTEHPLTQGHPQNDSKEWGNKRMLCAYCEQADRDTLTLLITPCRLSLGHKVRLRGNSWSQTRVCLCSLNSQPMGRLTSLSGLNKIKKENTCSLVTWF